MPRWKSTTQQSQETTADLTPDERADHCIAWINQYCKLLSDSGKGVIPFTTFSYQDDFLRAFWTHREIIVLKARQLGMTETVAALAVYCVQHFSGWTIIILSKDQDAANEVLSKCRISYDYLPDDVRVPVVNSTITSTLKLTNRSRIIPKPTSPGAGRSFNAQVLIMDEAAHMMWAETIYTAASPAARSAGNKIVMLSTANGVGNLFYKKWQLAMSGQDMHPVFLPWNIRPGRDAAWYEQATRGYADWARAQEFPQQAEEAFILSGRPRFDIAAVDALLARAPDPLRTEDNGHIQIWQDPLPNHQYVVGADTSEGLPKGDYSAAVIIDYYTGVEVAVLHGRWAPQDFAGHLCALAQRYNYAYLGVERANHGHAVLLACLSLFSYPNLYYHTDYDAVGNPTPRAGWPTTSKTKPIMIDHLARTFSEGRGWRNREMLAEARQYVINDNGTTAAAGDGFDDLIMAYAVAEQVRMYMRPQHEIVSLTSDILGLSDFSIDDRY